MANRAYLYSLSNRPSSFGDRPTSINGLAEWAWDIPFSFRLLMSHRPVLCSSLVSDGFDDDPPDRPTRFYAISADFEPGYRRLRKVISAIRAHVGDRAPALAEACEETVSFLEARRNRHVLMETIELDSMFEASEDRLRTLVQSWCSLCEAAGSAVDALSADPAIAGSQLAGLTPLNSTAASALLGLSLTDDFDRDGDDRTSYPMGLSAWSGRLFFDLWNRDQYQAAQT